MILAAESAGVIATLWEFVQDYPDPVVIGLLVLCGIGLPLPEEPVLLMAGAVVVELTSGGHEPEVQLLRMTLDCAVGILIGDLATFYLGRTVGTGIFRIRLVRLIATRPRRVRAERFFRRYGAWAIFLARFFAGVRLVMYFGAGMSRRVSYLKFVFMDFLGVVVAVPVSVWLGFIAYRDLRDWNMARHKLGAFHVILFGAIAVGLLAWFLLSRKKRALDKQEQRTRTVED